MVQQLMHLIAAGILLIGAESAIAQSTATRSANADSSNLQVLFIPPPDDKKPEETSGAGSRRDRQCPQDAATAAANAPSNQLTSLVPATNSGLTLAERPTFWVYLPKTSAKQAVLSLKEGDRHHSQTLVPITGEPGVIGIKLSDDSPALQVGKTYQWAVVLVCGDRPGPNDPAAVASVRRVVPQPQGFNEPLEQANWYGQQGIWYDALTALAQARRSQPHNSALVTTWANFLKSQGLEAIANQPLR